MIFSSGLGSVEKQTTDVAIKSIANHLRKLQDELEYRLSNLDSSNINEIDTDETVLRGGTVTLISQYGDDITELKLTNQKLTASVRGLDEQMSSLQQTATSLTATVNGLSGNVSTLQQTATSLTTTVQTQGQSISTLQQTSNTISATVQSLNTSMSQTVRLSADGLTVTNAAGSKLTIDGGQINADTLNLTGKITFTDLDADTQAKFSDVNLPNYIKATYIDEAKILSPTITGNDIRALQSFSVGVLTGDDTFTPHGHLGLAYGKDASDSKTYGVAMASAGIKDDYGMITYDAEGQYVIVTDSGVRMQAFDNNVTVTENNIYLSIKNDQDQRLKWIHLNSGGAFYNDQEIATKYDVKHIDSIYGAMKVLNSNDALTGWIGSGSGQATDGTATHGVAMAASTTPIIVDGNYSLDFDSEGRYILVTGEGIKLKSGENTRITLTDNTISVRALNGATMKLNGSEVVTVAMLQDYGLI